MSAIVAHTPAATDLSARLNFDADTINAARQLIAPNAPDSILRLLLVRCQELNVDPLGRNIYAIERGGKWSLQTSIDCFRTIANAEESYAGQTEPQWCGPDGAWKTVWLDSKPPAAARVGVWRKGFVEATYAVALWSEYYGANAGPIAKKMPSLMLSKVAEGLALRKAFPQRLAGLYTADEMQQADRQETAPARISATTPPRSNELLELHAQAGAPSGTLGIFMREVCNDETIGAVDPATNKRKAATADQLIDTKRALEAVIAARANAAAEGGEIIDAEFVPELKGEAQAADSAEPRVEIPLATETPAEAAQLAFATTTDAPPPGDQKMTNAQQRKVMAMFNERGYTSQPHRHAFAAAFLGEAKRSSSTWTLADAKRVIDKLELTPPAGAR